MLRVIILSTILALTLVPAPASAMVDICDTYGICVIARTGDDWACAGVGLGLQGAVVCGEVAPACVRLSIGFNRDEVCPGVIITLP